MKTLILFLLPCVLWASNINSPIYKTPTPTITNTPTSTPTNTYTPTATYTPTSTATISYPNFFASASGVSVTAVTMLGPFLSGHKYQISIDGVCLTGTSVFWGFLANLDTGTNYQGNSTYAYVGPTGTYATANYTGTGVSQTSGTIAEFSGGATQTGDFTEYFGQSGANANNAYFYGIGKQQGYSGNYAFWVSDNWNYTGSAAVTSLVIKQSSGYMGITVTAYQLPNP